MNEIVKKFNLNSLCEHRIVQPTFTHTQESDFPDNKVSANGPSDEAASSVPAPDAGCTSPVTSAFADFTCSCFASACYSASSGVSSRMGSNASRSDLIVSRRFSAMERSNRKNKRCGFG